MVPPIHAYVGKQEREITDLRNALLIASQYAAAFPADATNMPPPVAAWIKARIVYLIGLQTMVIAANAIPPVIPVPALSDVFPNAPTPA